eukprot:1070326-Amphidinium_carterae.2
MSSSEQLKQLSGNLSWTLEGTEPQKSRIVLGGHLRWNETKQGSGRDIKDPDSQDMSKRMIYEEMPETKLLQDRSTIHPASHYQWFLTLLL